MHASWARRDLRHECLSGTALAQIELDQYLTDDLVNPTVAREADKGRLLLVATTTIWILNRR